METAFGTVYLYGPNQTMGPANETEVLKRAGRSENGFTMVNEGPLEVKPLANGKAAVGAFSPSQGEQWTDQVRRCAPNELSAKFRSGLARLGLLPR